MRFTPLSAARATLVPLFVPLFVSLAALTSACVTATPVGSAPSPTPAPASSGATTNAPRSATPAQALGRWTVSRASHIDLWLHAFALLTADTTPVPLFRRHYRDSITAIKARENIVTSLDANRETLAKRFRTNPALVQAQFLALNFRTFAELKDAGDKFLQYQGDLSRAPDAVTRAGMAEFAAVFPTAPDREWLRLFMTGLVDEQARYYDAEYARGLRTRGGVDVAVDSLWNATYHRKFDRFLTNTSQRTGNILLSLPLGPEGRTSVGAERQTIVAVPYPSRPQDAVAAILVLAHEVVGTLVSSVVSDNTTPAQQRSGEAGNFVPFTQVHGGLVLLQRIAPELAEPYARFYLAQSGRPVPATNAAAALRSAFPVPQALIDGLVRQIDIVLAGI